MVCKYTRIFVFRKYTFSTKDLLILLMSAIFCKKALFLVKMVPLLKAIVWELCYRFFSSVFSFCKSKRYCKWKCKFCRLCARNPVSGLLQIDHKSEKWQWRYNWLVTDPSFMSISSLVLESWQFSLIRNWPEIRKNWKKSPSEVCPISGEWNESAIPNMA